MFGNCYLSGAYVRGFVLSGGSLCSCLFSELLELKLINKIQHGASVLCVFKEFGSV